ncbi:dihydrolipoamide acetyltransferase family protein [Rhodoluna limnophila]|uniref:dihydrolipoamide acetyltransferase family protein n=1 Tax=Rhodoluna limnophila TaxID=232537 RepID=UPI0011062A50|nr:dihydrolipoamide acetyltransferase family protein [Rhodoluna limnophila]
MTQLAFFNLPDVGEGLTEAEIVSWKVKPGDTVAVNQVIVEIETAKSLVELPCPFAGVVAELFAAEGDTVEVGKPIISATVADGAVGTVSTNTSAIPIVDAAAAVAAHEVIADAAAAVAKEEKQPNLVGYGASGHAASRRRGPVVPAAASVAAASASLPLIPNPDTALINVAAITAEDKVIAKPPIRKLAKDLGVDITSVTPTGFAGEVTREDVLGGAQQASVFRNLSTPEAPSAREERIPVKGVRKAIANAMVSSAFTAPHVSIFVDVDATRTMEYVKRLKASTDFAGVKVTPLLIMAKAMIWAVRRNPMVNSTWTDEEIIVHNFVNFGIAAATPRGLIVPNIKDADKMSMLELAKAIENLAAVAREGKTTPADMKDGTITITNIGVFGVDTGTPILNPGEVGIVALGSIRPKPWVVNNEIQVRQVTTIGATFDHRVVDGDVASRFVQDVASVIEEPALLLD